MKPQRRPWEAWGRSWLDFWYGQESLLPLAVMRIGVGLVLLYSLLVYSFDLTDHLAPGHWGDLALLRRDDPIAWPFSLFDWVDANWWIWAVHLTAMLLAVAFIIGLVPNLTGALAVVFYLSYGHRNPAVLLPLDGLLVVALLYLTVSPCGRALTMMPARPPRRRSHAPHPRKEERPPSAWGSLVLRLLQIHLCLLYFLSSLMSLSPAWLSGEILLHPRPVFWGDEAALRAVTGGAAWSVATAYGLTLLGFFYGVLVWLRRFRYPTVVLTGLVHAVVGFAWGLQTYNALMIVLNLAFIDARHLEWLRRKAAPFLAMPWVPPASRP